jgi:hypothetical protein
MKLDFREAALKGDQYRDYVNSDEVLGSIRNNREFLDRLNVHRTVKEDPAPVSLSQEETHRQ